MKNFVAALMLALCSVGSLAETANIQSIINDYTNASKRLDPYYSTYFNVEEDFSKFGDYPSADLRNKRNDLANATLEKVKALDIQKLSSQDQLAFELFRSDLELSVRAQKFPSYYLEFNQMGNRARSYLDDSSPDVTSFPFDSVKHFDDWIKRSEGFLPYVDRQIALLKESVNKKYVVNCVVAKKTLNGIKDGAEPSVEKNPFYRPLKKLPGNISEADKTRITNDVRKMITERIQPGFKKLITYYKSEYLPKCRNSYGLAQIKDGKEWYKLSIESSTGLKLTPEKIHQIGLSEVKRIRGEIESIKKEMGFKGSLANFFAYRRANPAGYFTDKKTMLDRYNSIKSQVDVLLPKYFSLLPKSDYKIVEGDNPEDAAASYYPVTEVLPYGRFVVNTMNLKGVEIAGATSLSLHESNPGHHLQFALQYEMKDKLSEYQRKMYFSTAFVEGWALYAEYLGREMQLYTDREQMLGHLNEEIWRAVRLVVDTGIHSYGWSREKVIKYMTENMSAEKSSIETEADRYSVWPGQALGYKIGQLKILELRHKAEKILAEKFDVREFHKAVLENGTISLPVLEKQVDQWITKVASQTKS